MSKHTPGPWERYGGMVVAYGVNGANICELSEPRASDYIGHAPLELGSPDRDEAAANGNLIAAAPELLEAAKLALKLLGMDDPTFEAKDELGLALQGAVAKAEGRKV